MRGWLGRNSSAVYCWTAAIAGLAIAVWASRDTRFHQFAIGLLCAAVTLLLATATFEIMWEAAAYALRRGQESEHSESLPKT